MINWIKRKIKVRKYVKKVKSLTEEINLHAAMDYIPACYYDEVYNKVK